MARIRGILTPSACPQSRRKNWSGDPRLENDEDDLLLPVFWRYAKLAGCPIEHLMNDDLELRFRDLKLVG